MKNIVTKIRNKKGITVVELVIIVVILIMVTATMVMSINTRYQSQKLDKLSSDLKLLKDKVLIYYTENDQYPIGSLIEEDIYEIDLSKLSGLTLNYGSKNNSEDDIYTINISTGTISYKKGIEYNGEIYYSIIADNEIEDVEASLVLKITNQTIAIQDENGDTTNTITITNKSYVVNLETGNKIVITVATNLDGEEGISYKWYRNGEAIVEATNNSYEISAGEEGDTYYCEITYEDITKTTSRIILSI